jgi:anti-sigma factor RsiW
MNHEHAWNLIPWVVNGRASEQERAQLEAHLEQCADCREELATQRSLMQAMRHRPAVESMPHAALQKLRARLDAEDDAPRAAPAGAPSRSSSLSRWLTAAVVVQALLLGALSMALIGLRTGGDAPYRTVSAPPAAVVAASVRAVFAPDLTLGELQALLERARLRIVDGPSPDGVLTLAPSAAGVDAMQALLVLRAHPSARFAEPVGP